MEFDLGFGFADGDRKLAGHAATDAPFPLAPDSPVMNAEGVIREYYRSLRAGEPIHPFFLAEESTVKVGVFSAVYGEAVADSLRAQTETTGEWVVESQALSVTDRGPFATFADEVRLAWTDHEADVRHRFETRWTGTLVRTEDGWRFVSMHVSAPRDRE